MHAVARFSFSVVSNFAAAQDLVLEGTKHLFSHRRLIHISNNCRDDLLFMLQFLDIAKKKIGMNLVTFRKPTHVYRLDSCLFGLGG
jgi:hypothetical protein